MPPKNADGTPVVTREAPAGETVPKEDFDKLATNYEKLAKAFNKLLKMYNDMFVASLFTETKEE